jgi:hypothetical protein
MTVITGPETLVKMALARTIYEADVAWNELTEKARAYYTGDQRQFLKKFDGETDNAFALRSKYFWCMNITQHVTNERGKLYCSPPTRLIDGLDDLEMLKFIQDYYSRDNFQAFMIDLDRLTDLFGNRFVVVSWDYDNEDFVLNAFDPDAVETVENEDNPRLYDAVATSKYVDSKSKLAAYLGTLGSSEGAKNCIKFIYSREFISKYKNDIWVAQAKSEEDKNPYQAIPVVNFKTDEITNTIWSDGGLMANRLLDQNLVINELLSELCYYTRTQCHGQWLTKGFKPTDAGSQTIWSIPEGDNMAAADAKCITNTAQIDQIIRAIESLLNTQYPTWGLSHASPAKVQIDQQSGVSIVMSRLSLRDNLRVRAQRFQSYERELFDTMVRVYVWHKRQRTYTQQELRKIQFHVQYNDLELPKPIQEEILDRDSRINNGLTSKLREFKKISGITDDEKAKTEFQKVIEENNWYDSLVKSIKPANTEKLFT